MKPTIDGQIPIDVNPSAIDVASLEIGVRALNCLQFQGRIDNAAQLIQKTESELMELGNFGIVCLLEVVKALALHGLKLSGPNRISTKYLKPIERVPA